MPYAFEPSVKETIELVAARASLKKRQRKETWKNPAIYIIGFAFFAVMLSVATGRTLYDGPWRLADWGIRFLFALGVYKLYDVVSRRMKR